MLALCRLLGWHPIVKQIHYDETCTIDFQDRGASLTGVDLSRSDSLAAPWPDAIIAIGRRSVPVTLWVKAQAGKQILHIHLGRPRANFALFDLVITSPQYNLPPASNVIEIPLPFVFLDSRELSQAAAAWESRFAALPRPWTAVMVGGPTTQLRFGSQEATQLMEELTQFRKRIGGSLLVTTSPRTRPETTEQVAEGLQRLARGHHLFVPFRRGHDNPYKSMLALADHFVVSVDSASMVAEAVMRRKPVHLFHLPKIAPKKKRRIKAKLERKWQTRRLARLNAALPSDSLDRLYDFFTRRGSAKPSRDMDRMEKRLIELGLAQSLNQPVAETRATTQPGLEVLQREVEAALDRINSLWCERAAAAGVAPPTRES